MRVMHAQGRACVIIKLDGQFQKCTAADRVSPTTSRTHAPLKADSPLASPAKKRARHHEQDAEAESKKQKTKK